MLPHKNADTAPKGGEFVKNITIFLQGSLFHESFQDAHVEEPTGLRACGQASSGRTDTPALGTLWGQ